MSSSSRISEASRVPGAAGAADVDRQAQRVPAVHARAPDEPLVEHVEPGYLADLGPGPFDARERLGEQLRPR